MSVKRLLPHKKLVDFMEKNKGISFKALDKNDAIEYMKKDTYYTKLNAYRLNFKKHTEGPNVGKYIDLEYAYLKELSIIDFIFRRILLPMSLDIEQGLKLHLNNDMIDNPSEDGYKITKYFLDSDKGARSYFRRRYNYCYCGEHVDRHAENMPIWVLFEVLPFGELLKLYRTYYKKYPSRNMPLHTEILEHALVLRNAAAHDNCILYDMNRAGDEAPNLRKYLRRNGMMSLELEQHIHKRVIQDFVGFILAYKTFVKSDFLMKKAQRDLYRLFYSDMRRHTAYFQPKEHITENYFVLRNFLDANFFTKKRKCDYKNR